MAKIPETREEIEAALAGKRFTDIVTLVHEWLHPLPAAGSQRVRLGVAFDGAGGWMAVGQCGDSDNDMRNAAGDYLYSDRIVFVEADLPPPEPPAVVRGRVA